LLPCWIGIRNNERCAVGACYLRPPCGNVGASESDVLVVGHCSAVGDRINVATMNELYDAMGDYTVPLRMSRGVDRRAERRLYEQLGALDETIRALTTIDRDFAANLVEFVHTSWAQVDSYSGPERHEVARSVYNMGETVLAVLNGERPPPLAQP